MKKIFIVLICMLFGVLLPCNVQATEINEEKQVNEVKYVELQSIIDEVDRNTSASTEAEIARQTKVLEIMNEYVDPEYYSEPWELVDAPEEMVEEIQQKALEITADCSTDYEKIKAVVFWIADNIYYNYSSYPLGNNENLVTDVCSVYKRKTTICDGYSRLTRAMLNIIDIPCMYILGENHAYNAAYDGQNKRWIYVDATWSGYNRFYNSIEDFQIHMGTSLSPEEFASKVYWGDKHAPCSAYVDENGCVWIKCLKLDESDLYFDKSFETMALSTAHSTKYRNDIGGIKINNVHYAFQMQSEKIEDFTMCAKDIDENATSVSVVSDIAGIPVTSAEIYCEENNDNLEIIDLSDAINLIDVSVGSTLDDASEGYAYGGEFTSLEKIIYPNGNNLKVMYVKNAFELIIPEGLTRLNVNLKNYYNEYNTSIAICIPDSVIDINGTFGSGIKFRCNTNSYAHQFAKENGIRVELLDRKEDIIEVTLSESSFIYDGNSKYPDVEYLEINGDIYINEEYPTELCGGYDLDYINNVNAGTATAIIELRDNAQNHLKTITAEFSIKQAAISNATVTLSNSRYNYDGKAKKPSVTVTLNGKTLVIDEDYEISYSNNINAGTATVTITGKGNYTGTAEATFSIVKKKAINITKSKVTLSKSTYYYDGKSKKPSITVKLDGKKLKKNTDYTVSYSKNKNIGTATVTIKGKGNYTGTVKKTFKITVKKSATYTVGANKYKISSTSAVSFAGIKSTKTTKVTIPKTVKIGGKTFKVTSIASKALYKKSKVKSVVVGENVTTIGKEAFRNCSKLSTITIKSSKLKSVGKNAFKGIKSTAKIKVPSKKLSAYKKLLKGKGQSSKVKVAKE